MAAVPLASCRLQGKLCRGRSHSLFRQLPVRALAGSALRGRRVWSRDPAEKEDERKGRTPRRPKERMKTKEVEDLKSRVSCAAVLEKAGFAIDAKESTRRAVKHRRRDAIIIVIHDGKGWFDPLSDAKGDVFSLIRHLDSVAFGEALERAAELVGFVPTEPAWTRAQCERGPELSIVDRWRTRRRPWPGSATWRYLHDERALPEAALRAAIRQDRLREGPYGSMWAAHVDDEGVVIGWEERGPQWRGFSTGGAKLLFRLGSPDGLRLCVTEAAIDAMSLRARRWFPATQR